MFLLGLTGSIGMGKTTTAQLLMRFWDPDAGRILIDGHDIANVTQDSLHDAIGVVPQDTVLFNETIRYNIAYGRADASFAEVEAAVETAVTLLGSPDVLIAEVVIPQFHPEMLANLEASTEFGTRLTGGRG